MGWGLWGVEVGLRWGVGVWSCVYRGGGGGLEAGGGGGGRFSTD